MARLKAINVIFFRGAECRGLCVGREARRPAPAGRSAVSPRAASASPGRFRRSFGCARVSWPCSQPCPRSGGARVAGGHPGRAVGSMGGTPRGEQARDRDEESSGSSRRFERHRRVLSEGAVSISPGPVSAQGASWRCRRSARRVCKEDQWAGPLCIYE